MPVVFIVIVYTPRLKNGVLFFVLFVVLFNSLQLRTPNNIIVRSTSFCSSFSAASTSGG